jgi:hypothetical protein
MNQDSTKDARASVAGNSTQPLAEVIRIDEGVIKEQLDKGGGQHGGADAQCAA